MVGGLKVSALGGLYYISTLHIIVPSFLFASGWMAPDLWKFIGRLRRRAGGSHLAGFALRNENYHVD